MLQYWLRMMSNMSFIVVSMLQCLSNMSFYRVLQIVEKDVMLGVKDMT